MKASTTILKNIDSTIAQVEINVADTKQEAKRLRTAGLDITAATLNRIIAKQESSAGWTMIVDGVQLPWSARDVKRFDIKPEIEESLETIATIVAQEQPKEVEEAIEEVITAVQEVAELDDEGIEGVIWSKRNAKAAQEAQPLRKNSKAWEIVVLLRSGRHTVEELAEALYKVGFDVDQVTEYQIKQAIYDIVWKGYNVGRIGKGAEAQWVIRHLDGSLVTDIKTY